MLMEVLNIHHYTWSWWSLPPLLAALYYLFIGTFVLVKNTRSELHISFFIQAFASFLWLISYGVCYLSTTPELALFWARNGYLGVMFNSLGIYHFCVVFTESHRQKKLVYSLYGLMVIFLLFSRCDFFLSGVIKRFWGYYPVRGGPLYDVFLFIFVLYWVMGTGVLFYAYRKQTSQEIRAQIRLLLVGFLVLSLAFGDYMAKYGLAVYPFGYLPVMLYLTIISYAITRYRLLDIETVIHQTVLWIFLSMAFIAPVYLVWLMVCDNRQDALKSTLITIPLFAAFGLYWKYVKPRIDHLFRRRRYDYLSVLGQLTQRIGMSLDIYEILTVLQHELKQLFYVNHSMVMMRKQDQQSENLVETDSLQHAQDGPAVSKGKKTLSEHSMLFRWLLANERCLTLAQLAADPKVATIRDESMHFMKQCNAEIVVPILSDHQLIGILLLGKRMNLQKYTLKDILFLENLGKQIGMAVSNALNHEQIVKNERVAEELRLGRDIQMSLMPQIVPEISGIAVTGSMSPALEIGGDYYDFIPFHDEDKLAVVIGDVSGKGVGSGLIMAMAKMVVYTLSQGDHNPSHVLNRANDILYESVADNLFMSMLYLLWDGRQRKMWYSSAGHEQIVVFHPAQGGRVASDRANEPGTVECIKSGGIVLAMLPDISGMIQLNALDVQRGDKIILYTDGITEAINTNNEMFGLEQLADLIRRKGALPIDQLVREIGKSVADFRGNELQNDDMTLVAIEIR